MPSVIMSRSAVEQLIEERNQRGSGSLDECWEGVWYLTDPTGPHQRCALRIASIHSEVVESSGRGTAWISINVTDREQGWKENHRCPDGAVILDGNPGRWIGKRQAAFLGGPDMAVEILSEDDPTYQKLDFYKARGVREVLVVDPDTGEPELWRLAGAEYVEVAAPLKSEVTGLIYSARNGHLEIEDPASGRRWMI